MLVQKCIWTQRANASDIWYSLWRKRPHLWRYKLNYRPCTVKLIGENYVVKWINLLKFVCYFAWNVATLTSSNVCTRWIEAGKLFRSFQILCFVKCILVLLGSAYELGDVNVPPVRWYWGSIKWALRGNSIKIFFFFLQKGFMIFNKGVPWDNLRHCLTHV